MHTSLQSHQWWRRELQLFPRGGSTGARHTLTRKGEVGETEERESRR